MSFVIKTKQFYFTSSTKINVDTHFNVEVPVYVSSIPHWWKITAAIRNKVVSGQNMNYLTVIVKEDSRGYCYEKGYCKIRFHTRSVVLEEGKSDTLFTIAPQFNQFSFAEICCLTKMVNSRVVPICQTIRFSLTIGSCYEEPPKYPLLKNALDNEILTDVVIKTKDKDFPCHKIILATKSDYFKIMFESRMKENENSEVNWVNVFDAYTVQDLLHYIYTGETPPEIKATYLTLVEAAHICLLDGLVRKCVYVMNENLNLDNVLSIMAVAEKYDLEELKESPMDFACKNAVELTKSDVWKELEPAMAKRILASFFLVLNEKEYCDPL